MPGPGQQPSPIVPSITTEPTRNSQSLNNPQTLNAPQAPKNPQPEVPAQNNQPFITPPPQILNPVPNADGVVLPNSATLPFGSQTTILGTVYSLSPNGEKPSIIIGSSTFALEKVPMLPGYSIQPAGEGIKLPNGETLHPSEVTTLDGVQLSVASDGDDLILGESTISPVETPSSEDVGGLSSDAPTNGMNFNRSRMLARICIMIVAGFIY